MPSRIDIENFIEGQYRKYFQYLPYSERDQQYAGLYRDFPHEKLREMFTSLHSELIDLFDTMNSRLPTDDDGAHFWADPSRDLIAIIDIVRTLQSQLENTLYAFQINDY